jgi:hypothetical protein
MGGLFTWYIYWNENKKMVSSKTSLSGIASVFVSGDNYEQAMGNLKKIEDVFRII